MLTPDGPPAGRDDGATATGKAPAFQFYPKDFLADENVRVMSLQERGAYITLLCFCWLEGSLPSDVARLARLCGAPVSAFRRLWPALAACFRPHPIDDQRLVNLRLEREREKQVTFQRRRSDAGKTGADKRWHSDSSAMPLPSPKNGKAIDVPMANDSFAVSSLQSPISRLPSEHVHARASDELAERAGRFCRETYPALYREHRKGAAYVSKPHVDFQEALELCRVFDDERLATVATAFLTTNHEFAEKGSRTISQFRALASWCDARLREKGL